MWRNDIFPLGCCCDQRSQIQLPIILFQLYVLIVVTSQLYKSSSCIDQAQELWVQSFVTHHKVASVFKWGRVPRVLKIDSLPYFQHHRSSLQWKRAYPCSKKQHPMSLGFPLGCCDGDSLPISTSAQYVTLNCKSCMRFISSELEPCGVKKKYHLECQQSWFFLKTNK